MSKITLSFMSGLMILMSPLHSAHSHHSGAPYDSNAQITIEGEVVDWSWRNPHSSLRVTVTDATGEKVLWIIEGTSPNILVRQGWKRSSLKPGDVVKVTIHPLRDGKPGGSLLGAVLTDGTVLGAPPGSSGRSLSAGGEGDTKE